MLYADTFKSSACPTVVYGCVDVGSPVVLVLIRVFFDEVKIEQGVIIHKLIDGVFAFPTYRHELPDETTLF